MSVQNINDLLAAIYQIADERNLPEQVVIDQIKQAYLAAFKKVTIRGNTENIDNMDLSVELDLENSQVYVFANKKVVSNVKDPAREILESKAKLIDPNLSEGDHIQIDVTPQNFGRIAAKVAFQKLLQGLREAEIDSALSKFKDKVGKIITGTIQKKYKNHIKVEVDKLEAIFPLSETIPGEVYNSGDRRKFLLLRLHNTPSDKTMVLSRAHENFIRAMFELEIPEISANTVEIVNIAREPGSRCKVAVKSNHEKVDPIGACIGPKGSRITTIMNEVPEKIDVILYDPDPRTYISNSLSPAPVLGVKIINANKRKKSAIVLVSEESLSLAIGKDGQNARLAAELTGYNIDITADINQFNELQDSVSNNNTEDAENINV